MFVGYSQKPGKVKATVKSMCYGFVNYLVVTAIGSREPIIGLWLKRPRHLYTGSLIKYF